MNRFETWLQLLTLLSVVAGVALVVWELQQTRAMTLTELVHGTITDIQTDRSANYGENLAHVQYKACFEPSELTHSEAFILGAFFDNQIGRVNRYKVQADLGGFETSWRHLGSYEVREVLSYPQDRAWLKHHPLWMHENADPKLREFFTEMIAANDFENCKILIERMVEDRNDDA